MARLSQFDPSRLCDIAHASRFRATDFARQIGVSERQLRRESIKQFGMTSREWLRDVRLSRSVGMLRKKLPVKYVAATLGFKQTSHFSREFKLYFGVAPSEFLRWDTNHRR